MSSLLPHGTGCNCVNENNIQSNLTEKGVENGNDLQCIWKDCMIFDSIHDINTA